MTNYKNTKRALVFSIISLFLCLTMLMGTTFAWFTDSVTSSGNVIQSGTLEAELYYKDPGQSEYKDASVGAIFSGDSWEPGHTVLKNIKIENKGSLAFKYQLNIVPSVQVFSEGPNLADVIDVYVFSGDVDLTKSEIAETTPIGSLSELMNSTSGILKGILLSNDSESTDPIGSIEYSIALKMRDELSADYQNLSVGEGFYLQLFASQYTFESDSFDDGYDLITNSTVTRQKSVFLDVTTDLPEGALASSPGVNFTTSPYAYTDTSLFAGKHITKLGIPVKTVKEINDEQIFTLSVVKTTSNTYEYVSTHEIKLPKDQLGDFTTVNKWIYVDLDIQLGDNETLAFGMPTDTVEWGYLSGKQAKYAFRGTKGSWTSSENASILFDVYFTETLEFTETDYGLAAVEKRQALPSVLAAFPESAISGGNDVSFASPPYCYVNQSLFSGTRVTKIGIPVKTVKAIDENQTFTLSVVKKGSGNYQYVNSYTLTLPVDQLGESTSVNKWIYVDLDINVGDDETLAFGGKNDTVIWAWKQGYGDTTYQFRNVTGGISNGIFFDVHTEKVYTYDEYLADQKAEQDRIEAEKEQARLENELKGVLSGKGISILGDSISTYTGWSNNTTYNSTIGSNAVYYNGSKDGFSAVNETWWMQTITRTSLELVVNNSWSGDQVTIRGINRSLQLHNNDNRNPDIIVVYLGINDFRNKVTEETFRDKYNEMISGIVDKYDSAVVYLFTLLYTTNVSSGVNPADVDKFNDIIRNAATTYGCTLVDIYNDTGITSVNLATYMGDKVLHPNYAGMDLITNCLIDALIDKYLQ